MKTNRAELYIEDEKLFEYAANTARLMPKLKEGSTVSAAVSVKKAYRSAKHCHDEISRRFSALPSLPSGCDWVMDNFYMVQREYQNIMPNILSSSWVRTCSEGVVPLHLCRSLLMCSAGAVTEKRLTLFLSGFQSVVVLRRSELELIPALLSASVILSLSELLSEMRSSPDIEKFSPMLEALFGTLRLFSVVDTAKLVAGTNVTDRILRSDPSGEYGKMDSSTRGEYLRRVQKLARREGIEEHMLAQKIIDQAAQKKLHVGRLLFDGKRNGGGVYIAACFILTIFLSMLAGFGFESIAAALLLILPVSELVKCLLDYILSKLVKPKRLFRMDCENGVPPEGKTICVISALIGGESDVSRLERLYHACKAEGASLSFGLLADLPPAEKMEDGKDAEALAELRNAVAALNLRYGSRFYLFTRKRSFDGERYSPFERKRGAILELSKLLCEKENSLIVTGDKDALAGTKFILTLDSDTEVYPGSVGELVGAMLHPLNRAAVDKTKKRVVSGHGIIHPRIDTELKSACETDFALIFAGSGGCDPYGAVAGELYMDAFGSGGFSGKGLIDACALAECTADFPEGRILSHDTPEGAILRGAYMGDAEFSDSFPSQPLGYYKRLHRWIRGDWQNISFIFAPDLRDIDRWRLFDNLRRSLIAPATFAAILAGLFGTAAGIKLTAGAAIATLLSRVLLAMIEESLKHREKIPLRRHTRLLNGIGGAIVQSFIRLWFLPYEAWVSLSAVLIAIWRMLISRKKLLQWQTAAAFTGDSGFASFCRAMWQSVILGAALMAFCPSVIGKATGFMWLLSPAAAAALALPADDREVLPESERKYLAEAAKRSYRYFSTFFTPEENFLPPDNFQEQPPMGLAHRTSPTNIALALTSAVAGVDLGFLSAADAAETTERIVETLEKIPKFRGHLYNWYNTKTLTPLVPAYISTVDSGNLYAGLVTAKYAMLEFNEPVLAMRIDAIMEKMDFSFLFDSERRLFHICYDTVDEKGAGGWYDLMASEAMLTSYIAAAKGDVPVKHWRRLSRAQLQKDGYRGLASWTGTMFEYLMPELFLPVYRGSLLYESCRFCVYVQKHRVWPGRPWGVSESAFYSFDSAMNYRYKAHGCDALSLKRGQDEETVVSPYSSFLALAVDPESTIRNLRRLESFGALGRFGFIEALDFTPGRCRSSSGERVRCYMAHHIGMSITAAANAACEGSIRKRFMASPEMSAFAMLLQERLPDSAAVIKKDSAEIPERMERESIGSWILRGGEEDTDRRSCLLSNGAYSVMSTNGGESRAVCGPVTVYDGDISQPGFEIWLERDGHCVRLIPESKNDSWLLSEELASVSGHRDGVFYSCTAGTAAGDCGELRTVKLRSDTECDVKISFRFHGVLANPKDYVNHPSYWDTGIGTELEDNVLLLHRLKRGGCCELWLAIGCDVPMKTDISPKDGEVWGTRPIVEASNTLSLSPGREQAVSIALCLSMERSDAVEGCRRILLNGDGEYGSMVCAAGAHLIMSGSDMGFAMELLEKLWHGKLRNASARKELWQYGISGEYPLICCDGRSKELEKLTKAFCLLKSCQTEAELAIFTDEQGEYRRPVYHRLNKLLSAVGLESLIGSGIYLVPLSSAGVIMSRSVYCPSMQDSKAQPLPVSPYCRQRKKGTVPDYAYGSNYFEYYVNQELPSRPWQLILSNGHFGYIAADCGSGYMWLDNAREMRIDPPPADAYAVRGSEELWCEQGEEKISLFAANDGCRCTVSYFPGYAQWKKETEKGDITLTTFIPDDINARVFIIEGCEGLRLRWLIKTALGAQNGASVIFDKSGKYLRVTDPESYYEGVSLIIAGSMPMQQCTDYMEGTALMTLVGDEKTLLVCGTDGEEKIEVLCNFDECLRKLDSVKDRWREYLGRISLTSGIGGLDSYMSSWCLYQTVACRLLGRTSLYQSGGAFGFRDQLQDAVNILLIDDSFAKERIIDCCRHQYTQGDVMHWWHAHPDGDMGVRTRCSDDLLWLCWALCEYCEKTGDYGICQTRVPYIDSPILKENERDRYEKAVSSSAEARVFDHAVAALECCMRRGTGEHGLPRIGSGDWNDALSDVKGESVWLAWFAASCAFSMARLCEKLGEPSQRYKRFAARMLASAENAWSGRWYLRGYYTDGESLGGDERIDSVAQSWAVLARGRSIDKRTESAIDAALHRLVDRKKSLVKLIDPPYSVRERSPGYISSYGEGIRENGGQYNHGAVWLAMACFKLGRNNDGWDILRLLLPEAREAKIYGAEPFVLSADVCTSPGHEGEAGWTWYTGSAGWYFRAVYETMLGLTMKNGAVTLSPHLPSNFPDCRVTWRGRSGREYEIELSHDDIRVNGEKYRGEELA